jgi:hypothetical protein
VIESPDVRTIYEIPLRFHEQGLDEKVSQKLSLDGPSPALAGWRELVQRVLVPHERVRIAVVGKYTDYTDSYKSVQEALIHGGIANDVGVDIQWMSSEDFLVPERAAHILSSIDGLLVPGGFGVRGVEGMVEAIRQAYSHDRSQVAFIVSARLECTRNPELRAYASTWLHDCLMMLVTAAHARGELSEGVEVAPVADMLQALVLGVVFYAGFVDDADDMSLITAQLDRVVSRGLCPDGQYWPTRGDTMADTPSAVGGQQ